MSSVSLKCQTVTITTTHLLYVIDAVIFCNLEVLNGALLVRSCPARQINMFSRN